MYDFDPSEYSYTSSEQLVAYNSIKEVHVIVYKNPCGFICASFIWMEPTAVIEIGETELLTIIPPYGEC